MSKLYYKLVGLVILLIVWVGFIGPYCINEPDDFLCYGYVIISIILIPIYFKFIPWKEISDEITKDRNSN